MTSEEISNLTDEQIIKFEMNDIGNYYGGLNVKRDSEGVCWWAIENYDGFDFVKIPESLYNELLNHYRNTAN